MKKIKRKRGEQVRNIMDENRKIQTETEEGVWKKYYENSFAILTQNEEETQQIGTDQASRSEITVE